MTPTRTRARHAAAALLLGTALLAAPAARAEHLTFGGAISDYDAGVDGLAWVIQEVVSPDGRHVYAQGASDDAVTALARDATTGALTFIEAEVDGVNGVDGLDFASSVAISPDGANVYATGSDDDAVAVFARSAETGALTFVEAEFDGVNGVEGLDQARGVTVSPDGRHVYVAGQVSNALVVFARDPATGALTFVTAYYDGVDGLDGLEGVLYVTVSPDGANVYTASYGENAVASFGRDPETGLLTYLQVLRDGENDIDGLGSVHCITVSNDGRNAYAASESDHSVATFVRNLSDGSLTLANIIFEGVDGVEGLVGALWVAISPDDTRVFVASTFDSAAVAFARDSSDGALTFLEAKREGVDGNYYSISFARSAVVSPDGSWLYVGGASSNAIGFFRIARCGDGIVNGDDECDDGNTAAGDCCSPTCTLEPSGTVCRAGVDACDFEEVCDGASASCPADQAVECSLCEVCDPALGCVVRPLAACRVPAEPSAAVLKLKRGGTVAGDALTWEWRKGGATTRADFGDPITTDPYTLCVFDESAPTPTVLLDAFLVPNGGACGPGPGPCWRPTKAGFHYRNASGGGHGITGVDLRAGAAGKAKITVAGRGQTLGLPTLPLAAPLRVQLQSEAGACWEARYPSAGIRRNDASAFTARSEMTSAESPRVPQSERAEPGADARRD